MLTLIKIKMEYLHYYLTKSISGQRILTSMTKEFHSIMKKESINQEEQTILNIYKSNYRT